MISNPKDLPNTPHPTLAAMLSELKIVWDVWHELKCKEDYLHQEQAEPATAYNQRLQRSEFDSRFKPAIKGYAGLLSEFICEEAPESIIAAKNNIDLMGNDITSFFTTLDEMVLRDGGCGVLVDFPKSDETIQSQADMLSSGRRPYLVPIDRRDILNWEVSIKGETPFIEWVILRDCQLVKQGRFGWEEKIYYRLLTPGAYQVYEIIEDKTLLIDSGITSLDTVPLVWYSITDGGMFCGMPPFLNLAKLNIKHFLKTSQLDEVLRKINMPVPVRRGMIKSASDAKTAPPIIIGPNYGVDIPVDGDFFFAEPTGNAIKATQEDIIKLEGAMDRVSLAFLTGGDTAKTATEVLLNTAQTQATLKGMARRKESTIQNIQAMWVKYTGETPGSADVNESVLQLPANPQEVEQVLSAMGTQISYSLGFRMLLQRKWLPHDTDIDDEIARLEGRSAEDEGDMGDMGDMEEMTDNR